MNKIKKELLPICAILAFIAAYIGAAEAKTYFYFESLPGLVNNENEQYPFNGEASNSNIEISMDNSIVFDVSQSSIDVTIDLSSSTLDTSGISLVAESGDLALIALDTVSGSGDIRTLTVNKSISNSWADVDITITASHANTNDVIETATVTFGSNCASSINTADAAIQKAGDAGTTIYCDTEGNYLLETAEDLLYITNYQDDANIGSTILAGDFKILEDIDFDISWSLSKTYQNAAGEVNSSKTVDYPYIKYASVSGVNNDVDWNLDGVVDDNTTEGWIPLGTDDGSTINIFTGSFDGNEKVIKNLYIGNSDYLRVGFIGRTFGATIHDIGIKNFYVNVDKDIGGQLGSLIGYMNTGHTYNSYSKNGVVIFQGSKSRYTGGLLGYQASDWHNGRKFSLVEHCYTDNVDVLNISSGNTRFSAAAGLTGGSHGSLSDGGVQKSYANGDVYCKSIDNGCNQAAGLVAVCEMSYIKDSYYNGDIKLDYDSSSRYSSIGGIAANNNGSAHNVYATGNSNQINAQYHGSVQGNWSSLYNSYAINDDMTVSTNATASSSRCSYGFDTGCDPLTIQVAWDTNTWNLNGIDLEPTLKNMPNF